MRAHRPSEPSDPALQTERELIVGEASVRYLVAGRARSDRPPVVLIHGTGGSTRSHFPFLFPMLARDQQVISIDLAQPSDATSIELEELEAQVTAVIREAAAPGVTLVGYSLGAVVAATVAGHSPDLIARLILISGWIRTDAQQRLRNRLWHEMNAHDEDTARRFTIFNAYSPEFLARDDGAAIADLTAGLRSDSFVEQQMDLNRRTDITETVAAITAPTLIVSGVHDQMVPPHHAAQLLGAIEDSRLAELLSGHSVVSERPAELVRLINRFGADPTHWPPGTTIPRVRP